MGLSAVVFKSAARLKKEYSREFVISDEETGQATAVGDEDFLSLRESSAARTRVGNLSDVAYIFDAVEAVLGEKSFIGERVLYSGSHAGDCIPLNQLQPLRDELNRLKHIDDSEVVRFVRGMEDLIEAAEQEGNPIVFV